ncbi:MAG: 4Fe-4S binding protein [Spirochaetaceae bacterium]|jgi:polyferredoxin|nr:4Fe-4S binding protein [Spirochaetaceae bacterium]
MNAELLKYAGLGAVFVWFIIAGRLFCGKVCPIGFIQGLLFKIPFPVKIKTFPVDKPLRLLKYAHILYNFVLPALFTFGILKAFKIYEAGSAVYIVLALIALILCRPFCKYLCAIGAISSLFNKFSLYKYETIEAKCVKCGVCAKKCPMNIIPYAKENSPECIRCGACKKVCPKNALISGFSRKKIKSRCRIE